MNGFREFSTREELDARERFVAEALSWVGTPFRDMGDIKGPNGAVDCAMLLTRCAVDTGLVPPFDPRPYPPRWMMRRDADERFLNFIRQRIGARETHSPKFGDVQVYLFGWTHSHGAIRISETEIVHAYGAIGRCIVSRTDESLLSHIPLAGHAIPRPVKFFDTWSAAVAVRS